MLVRPTTMYLLSQGTLSDRYSERRETATKVEERVKLAAM